MQELDKLEVSDLILMVRDGDDGAFSELIRRYLPMIKKLSNGFSGSGVRDDEAFCEASVAFYKAAKTYDLSRTDVTFGLYARICVHRRLCDLVGKEKGKEDLFSDLDVDNISVQSGIESSLVRKERIESALSFAKSLLSEYEYEVFLLHLEGYSTSHIAAKLGKSAKSVDNAKARAIKHLRDSRAEISDL